MGADGPLLLVTGASGTLGSAVLEAWDGPAISLVRRSGGAAYGEEILGDVAEPRLGLSTSAYRDLARRIDAVVHCAVLSYAPAGSAGIERANVNGTEHVLGLCADADVPLYHVGTALDPLPDVPDPPPPLSWQPYLLSKQVAESLVMDSGLPATVLRPSLIIGSRECGRTPRFQGMHAVARLLLDDSFGVLPLTQDVRADFLPRDVIAQCIVALVKAGELPERTWITAGERALRIDRIIELIRNYGRSIGLDPPPVRFVGWEVVDRLVRPALLPELPRRARRRFEYVIEFNAPLARNLLFPSDLAEIASRHGIEAPVDLEASLTASLRYWGGEVLGRHPKHPSLA